ncbi:hypothetical protein MKD49_11080 [Herbaspirillum sp. WGmk3]|uniref:hypothetical protein n=1 Tax=Herbaspirillum sp. WGmk3 TaxID=2919925 RepID=UPI0020914B1F|nr:hypothetical protein [Herbaspirillum sp. WGmk3]MCO4857022.1 hypothetical protein [Herbaspirillum sp. WGmk3]
MVNLVSIICLLTIPALAQAQINIGFYKQEKSGLSLYTTAPLTAIHRIALCADPSDNPSACHWLKPNEFKQAEPVDDVMAEQTVMHYRMSRHISPGIKTGQGIAIINAEQVRRSANSSFIAIAQRKHYKILICTGVEGINLELLDGPRKLHSLYFYLGYDTLPTCENTGPIDVKSQ